MRSFYWSSHRFLLSLAVAVALCLSPAVSAQAQRPAAPQLLPRSTALVFRIANAPELREKFLKTAIGSLSQDPQLKPLLDELYGEGVKAFDIVEQQIGVSLSDLLAIPQGEFVVGVIAPEDELPSVVVLLDTGDKAEAAQTLIDKATELLDAQGLIKNEQTIDETKVISYPLPGANAGEAAFFQRDNTVVVCSNLKLAKLILKRWAGVENTDDQLAKNPKYAAIMKKCRRSKKNPPQVTFFVDPIALAESATTGNPFAAATMAVLPVIGLDGFSGVGGSLTFDAEPFDMITQLHVLLENPRTGAIKLLALGKGDTTPQNWVPSDVASYSTIHWDFKQTFEQIGELVDSFQGSGAFAKLVENDINTEIGIDLEKDIIEGLAGRVTLLNWYERPFKLTSSSNLVAIDLKDPTAMQSTIDKLFEQAPGDDVEKVKFGNITYYRMNTGQIDGDRGDTERGDTEEERPEGAPDFGSPATPCVGIMGDVLLISDREALFKKVLTASGDSEKSLAHSEDYKLIARRTKRIAGNNKPGMVTFNRPEESLRFLYGLATSAQAQGLLKEQSEQNEFFRVLQKSLDNNPLPPFAVIAKYFAPAGGVLVNEETGFHYTGFTLRRK